MPSYILPSIAPPLILALIIRTLHSLIESVNVLSPLVVVTLDILSKPINILLRIPPLSLHAPDLITKPPSHLVNSTTNIRGDILNPLHRVVDALVSPARRIFRCILDSLLIATRAILKVLAFLAEVVFYVLFIATDVVPSAVVFTFYNGIRDDGPWKDRDECSPAAPAA
jgi:hypothetical protein